MAVPAAAAAKSTDAVVSFSAITRAVTTHTTTTGSERPEVPKVTEGVEAAKTAIYRAAERRGEAESTKELWSRLEHGDLKKKNKRINRKKKIVSVMVLIEALVHK